MTNGKSQTEEDTARSGAGRLLRPGVLLPLAALAALAGAALWLATDVLEPRRATAPPQAARAESPPPPIRLDKLPPSSATARRSEEERGKAKTAPVIGVGTDEFASKASSESAADATVEVDGRAREEEEIASDAEIKRQLVALARENARIEAALRGQGPGTGSGKLAWPIRGGSITSPFGPRWGRLHAGVDIGVPTGSAVFASDGGRVVVSGPVGGYGNYICIQHTGSLSTCYAHNSRLGVRRGQSVRKGALIAKSGCTGRCFGPNMHFETRVGGKPVDPMRYF